MKIIAGTTHLELAKILARFLNAELIPSIVHKFENSELRVNIKGDLKDQDVVIIQSTSRPANDNLMELLLLINAARQAKARGIIAVIPYFGYSRGDRITASNSSLSMSLVANLLESAGADKIITIDLHSKISEKFLNIPIIDISITGLFTPLINLARQPVIVSPDQGSTLRAQRICEALKLDLATINKSRLESGNCQMADLKGNVKDRHCIIIDESTLVVLYVKLRIF